MLSFSPLYVYYASMPHLKFSNWSPCLLPSSYSLPPIGRVVLGLSAGLLAIWSVFLSQQISRFCLSAGL